VYTTETTEFEGAKFQASPAVHLRPSFFRDVARHTLALFLDCFTLENGTDSLSRNVGFQVPTYAA